MENKGKILLVDDDKDIRVLVKVMMSSCGHEILEAKNGEECLKLVESTGADGLSAIFLDLLMPGMNGLDVLVRLKSKPETQNIPIIILTTEGLAEDIIKGYQFGADYYIPKPFTQEQLLYGLECVAAKADPPKPVPSCLDQGKPENRQ